MGVVISTLIRLYVARSSLRIICRIQSACLFRKSVEISLKLNESDQSNGLFALRVRIFEAQIEGFLENPIRPLWVDSCHSAIARQSLIKRLLHPRGTPHLSYIGSIAAQFQQ